MDDFNNVLTTFLGLERVSCIAVYHSDFIKKKKIVLQRWMKVLQVWDEMRVSN